MASRKREGKCQDVAVRERLLGSAVELFTRKGYAATTVREIVERAGVTKPVLYYYFRNKEGIYLELMREAFSQFTGLVGEVLGEPRSACERLLRLADRTYVLSSDNIDVTRMMYAIYYGPPQGAPFFDFDAIHVRFQEAVLSLVKEGVRSGELRNERLEDMMWAVIGPINVALELELCHPERGLGRKGMERVLRLILDGLRKGKGRGKRS